MPLSTQSIGGIISGLDTTAIIDALMRAENYKVGSLEAKITLNQERLTAWTSLSARLVALQNYAAILNRIDTYRATSAISSDEDILSTVLTGTPQVGSYSLSVYQRAQTHQIISQGYNDSDSATVGTGTISIELGEGFVAEKSALEWINGQSGFYRGSIKITDRSGASATIDLTGALTIQDVIDTIDNNSTINITASVEDNPSYNLGDALKLVDNTGLTTSNLKVEEVGGKSTASDLGILADVAANEIHGNDINYVVSSTRLELLNDRTGIDSLSGSDDFRITARDSASIDVDISNSTTLQDVIDAINNDSENGGKITASIVSSANGIRLTDNTGGGGDLSVASLNSSSAASDLGIEKTVSGSNTLDGDAIIAGLNTVLLKTLNGGSGVGWVSGDDFQVQMRSGSTFNVDISGDVTLQDVIDSINNAAGNTNVTASYDKEGHALLLSDTSSASNNLAVTVLNSSSAASDLGILKSVAASTLEGDDLNPQYIARSTELSAFNGGKGVDDAKIEITDRAGNSAEIDLTEVETVGQVLDAINNAAAINVLAQINSQGNGIEIIDLTGDSSGALSIEEAGSGTAAKDLNILDSSSASQAVQGGDINYLSGTSWLDILNDGTGIASGSITVTDRSGASDTIDLSSATTLQDVIDAIDAGANTDVSASLNETGDGIDIVDNTGQTDYNLKVEESGSTTAADLGIKEDVSSSRIYGQELLPDLQTTYLDWLNTQTGVSAGKIKITDRSGAYSEIDLTSAKTLQQVIDAINNDTTINVTASIEDNGSYELGDALKLVDNTGETVSNLIVEEVGSTTAADLGILKSVADTTLHGDDINSIAGSTKLTILRDLSGISQVAGDDFEITNRNGTTFGVDIDGATTLQDVIDAINAAGNSKNVHADLLTDGDGIYLWDTVNKTADLIVVNTVGSTTATELGIEGSVHGVKNQDFTVYLYGEDIIPDLDQSWLDSFKDGNGVTAGSIKITDRSGAFSTIDLSSYATLKEVLDAINNDGSITVTAALDSTKNKIIITDQSEGAGLLKIEEVANDTADDLGILEATGIGATNIEGSFETSITITSENNTLEGVRDAINEAKAGVQASIINDGSSINPYRLVVVSDRSGSIGRMALDADLSGGTELFFTTTTEAQDVAVILGEGTENPVLITDTSNYMDGIIPGLTLNLLDADSSKIVEIKIEADISGIAADINSFLDAYNEVMELIGTHQSYDADLEQVGGVLFGEVAMMNVRNDLHRLITNPMEGSSSLTSIFQVGVSADLSGVLSLDTSKLTQALTEDLEGVKNLFTSSSNIALSSFGTSVSVSSQYSANYNMESINNGDTSSLSWGSPGGGWMDDSPGSFPDYLTMVFDERRTLRRAVIYTLDSQAYPASTYGIKDYILQYLKRTGDLNDDDDWVTVTTITDNTEGSITHYFNLISTGAIRLQINASNGVNDYSRIVEFEAFQDVGVAGRMYSSLRYFTDAALGSLATIEDALNNQIEDYEDQIASQKKLTEMKQERLIKQFNSMEGYLARMQTQSSWLTLQVDNLDKFLNL